MAEANKKREKKVVKTRQVPANAFAEQSLLGCVLCDFENCTDVMGLLSAEDFYSESHRLIFEAMSKEYSANRQIDIVTVSDRLSADGSLESVGGMSYLTRTLESVPSSANFRYYLEIVQRDSAMRKLIRAGEKINEVARSGMSRKEAVDIAVGEVFDIGKEYDTSQLEPMTKPLGNVLKRFVKLEETKGEIDSVKTGFKFLDQMTRGLQKGDLILIAARPSMGKTALGMNIIENAALQGGARCAVFSLEMSREQLVMRLLCSVARVSMTKALQGKLSSDEWQDLWKANSLLSNANIYIDDSSMIRPSEMISKCRRLSAKEGLDLILVDYIQLMNDEHGLDNRQQAISEISRSMKMLAKELNVPVIALSQLSRAVERRTSQRPMLSDLRESGAIEQDADIVMFIHRPDKVEANQAKVKNGTIPENVAQLIVAKHRNGQTGDVALGWNGESVKFFNVDKTADELFAAYNSQIAAESAKPSFSKKDGGEIGGDGDPF